MFSSMFSSAKAPENGHVAESQPGASAPQSKTETPVHQHIDAELLKTSLEARVAYLKDFIGFTPQDNAILRKLEPLVVGLVPGLVDAVYLKLFQFDITKQVFMTRNHGFEGEMPATLEELTLDSPQIKYRKSFLKVWAARVFTSDLTSPKIWEYMDKVGIMHTGVPAFKKQPLHVAYRDCAILLGYVQSMLQTSILGLTEEQLSMADKVAAVDAVNKVMWIQNDLFARHYVSE